MSALAQLFASHLLLGWLAIGAVFLVVELMTGSGWLLWTAGSAAAIGLTTLVLPMPFVGQAALFVVLTVISTFAGRRWLAGRPRPAEDDVNALQARLIGHSGRAVSAFHDGEGRVFIDGKEWAAEADAGDIASGARVIVVAMLTGARLKVRIATDAG